MYTDTLTLFVGTFTTLLAIINPLQAVPIYLKLVEGQTPEQQSVTAKRSCMYATVLMFFFLLFGNLLLMFFGVPLSMVRMVGGLVLLRIGFSLFMPSGDGGVFTRHTSPEGQIDDVSFIPMAMPIMFGPGAMATLLGMASTVKQTRSVPNFFVMSAAILLTMAATYIALAYARKIFSKLGVHRIDAATRIVGFFIAAMGMGLVFNGLEDVLALYGIVPKT